MNKSPDIIFLDMDNTLYEYAPCHDAAIKGVQSYLNKVAGMEQSIFNEGYKRARQEVQLRLFNTASSHNRLLYFQKMLENNECKCGAKISLAMELYKIYWEIFLDNIKVFEGVYEFLVCAKKAGVSIALVTDLTAEIQFKKIIKLNLENMIDAMVTSEESGRDKPDRAIFEIALKKLGRKAEKMWMIGDDILRDIVGGRSIGAVTFLKSNDKANLMNISDATKPDHIFESFYELIDILAGLERQ